MRTDSNPNTKEMDKIVRSIMILIVSFVTLLMLPFLSGLLALPFFIFGHQSAYVVSRIIQNLYGPILVVAIVNLLPIIKRIFSFLHKGGIKLKRPGLKNVVITVAMLVIGIGMTFQSFQNLGKLVLDTGIILTSQYEETQGRLVFYELLSGGELSARIEVNDIRFDGGYIETTALVEGNQYRVKYLPHTKYVVSYEAVK